MAGKVSGSEAWARDVLAGLGNRNPSGLQVSILTMLAQKAEGVPTDNNNPLDIEQTTPSEWGPVGAATKTVRQNEAAAGLPPGIWNKQGVVTYATYAQGVKSTVAFLHANHPKIVTVLSSKDDPSALAIGEAFLADGAWGNGLKKDTKDRKAYWGDSGHIVDWVTANTPTVHGIGVQNVLAANKEAGNTTVPNVANAIQNDTTPRSGCSKGPDLIGFDTVIGHQTILSRCEGKALIGGFVLMFGVLVMAGGVTIIIKNVDDRFDLRSLASSINKPAVLANNALSNLFNRSANRQNQRDQDAASRYTPPTPPAPKPTTTTSSTRYVPTVPYGPTVSTSKPTPTAAKPTRIPRKQKNAKGPSRT